MPNAWPPSVNAAHVEPGSNALVNVSRFAQPSPASSPVAKIFSGPVAGLLVRPGRIRSSPAGAAAVPPHAHTVTGADVAPPGNDATKAVPATNRMRMRLPVTGSPPAGTKTML